MGPALRWGRQPSLKRAGSFHDFHHVPLEIDYRPEDIHRTVATFTSHFTRPSRRRSVSSDHARIRARRDSSSTSRCKVEREVSSTDAADADATPGALPTLCDTCLGVNIDSLSAPGGYAHLTLDVIQTQASHCKLCEALSNPTFSEEDWTMDRYRAVLSLRSPGRDKPDSDHFISESLDGLYSHSIWVDLVDTRPDEFPEGKTARLIQMGRLRLSDIRSGVASEKDRVVRGRPMLCYTDQNDPATAKGVPWLRPIGENTASAHSLGIAKGWLAACLRAEKQHGSKSAYSDAFWMDYSRLEIPAVDVDHAWTMPEDTHSAQSTQSTAFANEVPARLLFISNLGDVKNLDIRLVETHGASYSYATLSYCWGTMDPQWLCTSSNIDQYRSYIDRLSLPTTIRDSITISAALGIRYLWIDALCIIQDDNADWETESAKMGGIYQGSLLTIAAAKSSNSDGGCFNRLSRPRFGRAVQPTEDSTNGIRETSPDLTSTQLNGRHPDLICLDSVLRCGTKSRIYVVTGASEPGVSPRDELYDADVVRGPLSRRAWVLQEQVLSRRTLYFGDSQLFWECGHCRLSEDNWPQEQIRHIYPIIAYRRPLDAQMIIAKWYLGVVQSYSSRGLTEKTDKLIAVSAVAQATYLNRNIEYVAGLWKDCIMAGLLWQRSSQGRKSRIYQVPSWSWASQESSVSYDLVLARSGRFLFHQPKVIDVHAEPSPTNAFGDVRNGYVILDTVVASAWVLRRGWDIIRFQEFKQHIIFATKEAKIWQAEAVMDDEDYPGGAVTVALLSDHYRDLVGLLLEPLAAEPQTYRRVGIMVFRIPYEIASVELLVPWERKIITVR